MSDCNVDHLTKGGIYLSSYGLVVNGTTVKTDEYVDVINPAHKSQTVGAMPVATAEQVHEAIAAAEHALQHWRNVSPDERAALLEKCADAIEAESESLATLLVLENGKVLSEAKQDIANSVGLLRGIAASGREFYRTGQDKAEPYVRLYYEPIGVVGIITPWNSPLVIAFRDMTPALMAGCPIILKPSSLAPLSSARAIEIMADILPPGVVNLLTGSAQLIGDAFITHPSVKMIAFTGSTYTGDMLLQQAAPHWKRMKMELGGNDPAIVLDDVFKDSVLMDRLINGILRCTGQICFAIKRIYVPRNNYSAFADALAESLDRRIVVGDGLDSDVTMGPLISEQQHRDVSTYLENARSYGAEVRTCGTLKADPDEGFYMLPHVITNVDQTSEIVRVEQFGPLIPVVPYDDIEEAVAMANDTEYGLRASVWSADVEKAAQIGARIEASVTVVNNFHGLRSRYSFAGWKRSGVGGWSAYGGVDEHVLLRGVAAE